MSDEKKKGQTEINFAAAAKRREEEHKKRDEVLDALQATRRELVVAGLEVAKHIATAHGSVTSEQVRARMAANGWAERMAKVDPRWIGGVFGRENAKLWKKVAYVPDGSHGRPVAMWNLR